MKEKLSLKPKTSEFKETKGSDHHQRRKTDLFKPVKISEVGIRTIGIVQSNFDTFWHQLSKIDGRSKEIDKCLQHLQEACTWYCRSVALHHKIKEDV